MYTAMSVVFVTGGVANLAWSVYLIRSPGSLSPSSFMYRWIYMRWTLDSWKRGQGS